MKARYFLDVLFSKDAEQCKTDRNYALFNPNRIQLCSDDGTICLGTRTLTHYCLHQFIPNQ